MLPYVLFEKHINIFALEMASPGNRHNCVDAFLFPIRSESWIYCRQLDQSSSSLVSELTFRVGDSVCQQDVPGASQLRSPRWQRRCLRMWSDCEKVFWQMAHEYGRSPVCVRMCFDRLPQSPNLWLQSLQTSLFEKILKFHLNINLVTSYNYITKTFLVVHHLLCVYIFKSNWNC